MKISAVVAYLDYPEDEDVMTEVFGQYELTENDLDATPAGGQNWSPGEIAILLGNAAKRRGLMTLANACFSRAYVSTNNSVELLVDRTAFTKYYDLVVVRGESGGLVIPFSLLSQTAQGDIIMRGLFQEITVLERDYSAFQPDSVEGTERQKESLWDIFFAVFGEVLYGVLSEEAAKAVSDEAEKILRSK